MSHRPNLTIFAALMSALLACDGVGRPLVDKVATAREPKAEGGCEEAPSCERPDTPAIKSEAPRMKPVDLTECSQLPRADDSSAVVCSELSWLDSDDGETQKGAYDFSVSHSNWSIEAHTPMTVTLTHGVLNDVWIALSGPVTLSIREHSKLSNVRIQLTANEGEPRVVVEDSQTTGLAIDSDGDGQRFGGAHFVRVRLSHAQIVAGEIDLESVLGGGWEFDAERLRAIDVTGTNTRLGFTEGSISASTLLTSEVTRCGTASIVGTTISESTISPCRVAPLRMYSSHVRDSFIDGSIESDGSDWTRVRFGARAFTELSAWHSVFDNTQLCGNTQAVRFGELGAVSCMRCPSRAEDATTCEIPYSGVALADNECPSLSHLEPCDPAPIRARPAEL